MANFFHKLKVKNKAFLTNNATLLTFDVPENLTKDFNFISGQYLTLSVEINGGNHRRSYSICSSPHENELSVVVKAIDGGIFSNFIKNSVEIGDDLDVSVPEGRFIYKSHAKEAKKVFLIAAGSGITPIFSIVKNILFNETQSEVTLLYSNKTQEDTIFYQNLQELASQFPDRLKNIYIFSREEHKNHHNGRINYDFLENQINSNFPLDKFSEFYNCGPENLTKEIFSYLKSIGISEDKIKSELFYSQEHIFENNAITPENTNVEVIINEESFFVNVQNKKNLLEELLDEGLDIPYSCKKGNCSSCVGKVISGTVEMKTTTVLLDDEVENGFILTCQSIATCSDLVISYDEY